MLRPIPRGKESRLDALADPPFLVSLAVLLANDFLLKPAFHAPLTGKLSDFAGLIVFPLFLGALLPRWKTAIFWITGAAFIAWKAPWSAPAIGWFNRHSPIDVGRTEDWTDLGALVVLPLAHRWQARAMSWPVLPWSARGLIVAVSVIALTATSYRTSFKYPAYQAYALDGSPAEARALLDTLGVDVYPRDSAVRKLSLEIPAGVCFGGVTAAVSIDERPDGSVVRLLSMTHRCPANDGDSLELLRIFDHCLVARYDSAAARRRVAPMATYRRTLGPPPLTRCASRSS
jgi:hypothetical protein